MSTTCPQGHTSSTEDFCDVCGAPIAAAGTPESTAGAPGSTAGTPATSSPPDGSAAAGDGGPHTTCPNCQAQNAADALFCEDCGYDFATGQLPPPAAVPDPVSGVLVPPTGVASGVTSPGGAAVSPPDLAGVEWVAEVWVDPDWFASQQAEGACPSSGLPTVVPLKGTEALIGRRSKSRSLTPDIDCTGDGAISHRHATLTLAGEQWSVEDLVSTNGTFVGRPDGTFPSDPIAAHEPHALADDERIYLGAWTRIVVRRATAQEQAGSTA